MSSKRLSPAAQLLRNSRLFSLPSVLQPPPSGYSGRYQETDPNSTPAHPIQQAITTTPTSQARGDWGLKRPLPRKSTARTSTPLVRINAIDTFEHITDFESASDLTLTLRKLQELGISISVPQRQVRASGPEPTQTVFEESFDNTVPLSDPNVSANQDKSQRWKYDGPWLAGMTDNEFYTYLEREIPKRKDGFMAFLRSRYLEQRKTEIRMRNRAEGELAETTTDNDEVTIDESAFREWVLSLRANISFAGELSEHLASYLDLPPIPDYVLGSNFQKALLQELQVEAKAPVRTHPSAGLSYLRTDARMENHPLFGPQRENTPYQARVLRQSLGNTFAQQNNSERYGLAGVVIQQRLANPIRVPREADRRFAPHLAVKERSAKTPGYGIKGGNAIYVTPKSAQIDEKGRIRLRVESSSGTAVLVKENAVSPSKNPQTIGVRSRPSLQTRSSNTADMIRGLDRIRPESRS